MSWPPPLAGSAVDVRSLIEVSRVIEVSSAIQVRRATGMFGSFTAVDAVDLDVGAGEVVGLLGPNGAGKTTLIRMILGLLGVSAGSIRLFGEPPSLEQRRRIGYVPQNLGLYPDLTVAENLEFRAGVFGDTTSDAMPDIADVLVGQLPHGLQRRVAFAAALQHQPDLLVLDEPTSGVSPLARSELWDLLRQQADRGTAVLVSTHYLDEALQADRLVVLVRGKVAAGGSTEDVVADRMTVMVTSDRWTDAFAVLDRAGHDIILSGRDIRVPSGTVEGVRQLLGADHIAADVSLVPATLDETLLDLSR